MKRAIVTGGAGFIGSHMVDLLLDRDFEVRAIDNLVTGRLENLAQHRGNPRFSFERVDMCDLPPTAAVELLGGPVVHVPKRPGEPDCTWADIGKITRALGWKPEVSFEEGVAAMVRHIDDWRSAPLWTPESIETATKTWFAYLTTRS